MPDRRNTCGETLIDGWSQASTAPADGPAPAGLHWRPMPPRPTGADAMDHWFRRDIALPPGGSVEFQGLATHTEIWLDGACVARHATMFRPLLLPIPPQGATRLEICARALAPAPTNPRPRPRWRNLLVPGESLRSIRTSLQGRIPGTGDPVVGPFRPVLLHPGPTPLRPTLRTWMEDDDGILEARLPPGADRPATLRVGSASTPFLPSPAGPTATLRLPRPERWWPHTHGAPTLHTPHIEFPRQNETWPLPLTGFRTVQRLPGPGLRLAINGVPIFCRGALWSGEDDAPLHQARAAGLNMVRIPGIARYPETLGAPDALGLLVWQDFMFARFDYPTSPAFLDEARAEARHQLTVTAANPSLVVLCGGHEVTQAAAMAGRPAAEWQHPLFDDVLPDQTATSRPDAIYVPNAPHGSTPPFAASAPVAHYFGVGAYQRPLTDAACVHFAAACLAFANPPDPESCRAMCITPGDAAWAAAVPRDLGASWTFEDTSNHYATTLLAADPATLRHTDPERWLATNRAAVALAMQSALTTWRADPTCGGALILSLQDTVPGPGWGLIDHRGRPKSALHAVAQVSAPIQALLQDAAMDGLLLHVFNDAPTPLDATLTLRGLTPSGAIDVLGTIPCRLPPHGRHTLSASTVAGRFQDLTGAWRFGPPAYQALGAILATTGGILATATHVVSLPLPRENLGLSATPHANGIRVSTTRFAHFVTLDLGRHTPAQDHFHLWPGESTWVEAIGEGPPAGSVSALNGLHPVHVRAPA